MGLHQACRNLRDYSKAPFFLAVIATAGAMVRGPWATRRVLLMAVLGGWALGVGIGVAAVMIVIFVTFAGRRR